MSYFLISNEALEKMKRSLVILKEILGTELLASILNLKKEKLEYYISHPERLPSGASDKLDILQFIIRNISGCYPPERMKNFFLRKHSRLEFRKPKDILKGNWWTRDRAALEVLHLACDMGG